MKRCSRCDTDKPLSSFSKQRAAKDGLQNWCRDCKREFGQTPRQREYQLNYQRKARRGPPRPELTEEERRARASARLRRVRDFVIETKRDKPCSDCGEVGLPHEMHYHHLDPRTKRRSVAAAGSIAAAEAEIAKCLLLCRSCHLRRHAQMNGVGWWRFDNPLPHPRIGSGLQ